LLPRLIRDLRKRNVHSFIPVKFPILFHVEPVYYILHLCITFIYINFHYCFQKRFLVGCVINQFTKAHIFVIQLSKLLCGNAHKNILSPFCTSIFLSYPLFEQNKSKLFLIKGKGMHVLITSSIFQVLGHK